jgi:hypothetical protein
MPSGAHPRAASGRGTHRSPLCQLPRAHPLGTASAAAADRTGFPPRGRWRCVQQRVPEHVADDCIGFTLGALGSAQDSRIVRLSDDKIGSPWAFVGPAGALAAAGTHSPQSRSCVHPGI